MVPAYCCKHGHGIISNVAFILHAVLLDVKPHQMKQVRKEIARIRSQLKLQTPGNNDTDTANIGKVDLCSLTVLDSICLLCDIMVTLQCTVLVLMGTVIINCILFCTYK